MDFTYPFTCPLKSLAKKLNLVSRTFILMIIVIDNVNIKMRIACSNVGDEPNI